MQFCGFNRLLVCFLLSMHWNTTLPPFFPPIVAMIVWMGGQPALGVPCQNPRARVVFNPVPEQCYFLKPPHKLWILFRLAFFASPEPSPLPPSPSIHIPNSLIISPSSSFQSSSQITLHPISNLTAFDSSPFLTDSSPVSLHNPSSFTSNMPFSFPANTLFLSTNFFSFPFSPFGPFCSHSSLSDNSNLFPLLCWALVFLVALTSTRCIGFLSPWLSETAEMLQSAAAEVAVVQPRWLLLIPATLADLLSGGTLALTKTFSPVDTQIFLLHFLHLVRSLLFNG
jgi:hypothetical protein